MPFCRSARSSFQRLFLADSCDVVADGSFAWRSIFPRIHLTEKECVCTHLTWCEALEQVVQLIIGKLFDVLLLRVTASLRIDMNFCAQDQGSI